jgi:hypothetical protein
MANLLNRMKRAEEKHKSFAGEKDDKVFFFRLDPEVPGEQEKRFFDQNPDFDGEVTIFHFGKENLNPYVPDS